MHNNPRVELRPIDSVTPYVNNPRVHSPAQIGQIKNSMSKFGIINPVIIDRDNTVIAGHGRLLAARELGLKVIPTIRADHLTPEQVAAYRLADNKIAENADWDDGLLKVEFEYLAEADIDFDMALTGFSTPEIDLLLHCDPAPDDEEPPVPIPEPTETVSRAGDCWDLEHHRVTVGDCRNDETVDRLMQGKRARAAYQDSPYNCPIERFVSGLGKHKHHDFQYASGEMSELESTGFPTEAMQQSARVSEDGALQYWFSDWRSAPSFLSAGKTVYDRHINTCVWAKTNAGMGSLYRSQHELVWVFKHGAAPHTNNVELGKHGRYRTNLWTYTGVNAFGPDRDEALAMHPTVKPVALLADAILDVTHPKDIVIDFFLGSGSTLIAAENTGRICYGIEIEPRYVDVAIKRWERATGKRAVLAGTGRTMCQVAAERGVRWEVAE